MKRIIISIISILAGFILATSLFNEGYKVSPFLKWDWSLNHLKQNCLSQRVGLYENGAMYKDIYCYKNTWKYED